MEYQIKQILETEGLVLEKLLKEDECPVYDKFDDYIPAELLRCAYVKDRLLADEILEMYGVDI